ncbi:hypothetical protein RRG08_062029 [Elysia crispata]|uniref:Uncharacterized protein n=1 Tax=Elysia crispata TaxID=231223 RepID=A0AAE1A3S7_9GAST|nr:hypothetical protein RRG08_062029 [Elysia crispata]
MALARVSAIAFFAQEPQNFIQQEFPRTEGKGLGTMTEANVRTFRGSAAQKGRDGEEVEMQKRESPEVMKERAAVIRYWCLLSLIVLESFY